MSNLITPQILPHPKRGTMDIGTERILPIWCSFRAADGATEERPILTVVGTDGSEDRHGSVINPDGWQTDAYMRNPVVLWQHGEVAEFPYVGKTLAMRKVGGAWESDIELLVNLWRHMPCNLAAFLWEAYRDHSMGAISVSFIPKKWQDRKAQDIPSFFSEDTEYTEQELTEQSFVNVPSNRNGLAKAIERARSAGTFGEPLARMLGFAISPISIIRSTSSMTKQISPSAKRHHITDHHRGLRAVGPFEFASTQVNLTGEVADKVLAMAATIPDDVLSDKGRETAPHVTVKYGIDPSVEPAAVGDLVTAIKPWVSGSMTLGATACFDGDEYDVVYVAVESVDLDILNASISEGVQTTDTQPEYVPHITLAYVKPGEGQKFVGDETLAGTTVTFDAIAFSDVDGNLTEIPLTGDSAVNESPVAEVAEETRLSRAKMRAILRCCGCGSYDEKPPVISEAAKAAEVPMLRQAAEISMQQVELGMTIWKTAETEQVRNIGNSLLYDGMWRFDRCLYFLNEWYGEDLEVTIPADTVDEAERALKNYRATRAGAVFSKKNLDKISQIGSLADELLSAATKPGADDVPTESDRTMRFARAARSTSATASADMKMILDSIITESADLADGQKATAATALGDVLSTIEGLLADAEATGADVIDVSTSEPAEQQRSVRERAARALRSRTRIRRAKQRAEGDVVDLSAVANDIIEALDSLADVAAALPAEVQAEIDTALDDVITTVNEIHASLGTTVSDTAETDRNAPIIRIKIGDSPSRQTVSAPVIRIAADPSDVASRSRSNSKVRRQYDWLRK